LQVKPYCCNQLFYGKPQKTETPAENPPIKKMGIRPEVKKKRSKDSLYTSPRFLSMRLF
jgi:hypothetical protein